MAQNIYFDESGFTGNNLLHEQQKFFAYASVATDSNEAKEVVEQIVKDFRIQGSELKGKNLVKFNKGRHAIDKIIERFEGRIKVSISDKKYALACKFFEYVFEPAISEINSLFYASRFHLFIANLLYLEFVARGAGAEQIFSEFENLMRDMDEAMLANLFSSSVHQENSPALLQIRDFALYRREDIKAEMDSLRGGLTGKWVLDITDSALTSLLAGWGQVYGELTAICDESKPLAEAPDYFSAMVGNTSESLFVETQNGNVPITFNLSHPLIFANSKQEHGIQIADTIAAAVIFAVSPSGQGDKLGDKWRAMLPAIAGYGSVMPDFDHVDLNSIAGRRNALILHELHSRASKNESLIDGMPEYVEFIADALEREARGFGPRIFGPK